MRIPKSKKDILVKNYLKYVDYVKTEPTKELEIVKNTVKIFYDLDDENFNKFEYSTIFDMYQIIENILQIPQAIVPIFTFNDIEYGLNPNFNDMTFGEYVDCDTEDIIQQICILYRPIISKKGKNYKIEPYSANIEIIEELRETLTLDIYLGFVEFFFSINQSLLTYTLHYLKEKATQVEKRKVSQRLTDGMDGFMTYVRGILPKWIVS